MVDIEKRIADLEEQVQGQQEIIDQLAYKGHPLSDGIQAVLDAEKAAPVQLIPVHITRRAIFDKIIEPPPSQP